MTVTKQEWIDLWKILGEDFFIDMMAIIHAAATMKTCQIRLVSTGLGLSEQTVKSR